MRAPLAAGPPAPDWRDRRGLAAALVTFPAAAQTSGPQKDPLDPANLRPAPQPIGKQVTAGSRFNPAISVISAVRLGLSLKPIFFTSLKAAAYAGLLRAGGGGARNWSPEVMAKGVTCPQWGPQKGS